MSLDDVGADLPRGAHGGAAPGARACPRAGAPREHHWDARDQRWDEEQERFDALMEYERAAPRDKGHE